MEPGPASGGKRTESGIRRRSSLKAVAPRQQSDIHAGAGPRALAAARISAHAAQGNRGVLRPFNRTSPNQAERFGLSREQLLRSAGRRLYPVCESQDRRSSADFSTNTWRDGGFLFIKCGGFKSYVDLGLTMMPTITYRRRRVAAIWGGGGGAHSSFLIESVRKGFWL